MNRRTIAGLAFLTFCGPLLGSDWRATLLSYLGPSPDFPAAREFLERESASIPEEDRQTALAIMAYFCRKTSDLEKERLLVTRYFETYFDNQPDFGFLDDWTRRDFLSFWGPWTLRYPLVTGLSFLEYRASQEMGLPATIQVGMDLLNAAYFKVSRGDRVLEGGHWGKGFHILDLPVSDLFEQSGTHEFSLILKAGDLVVRKPILIDIEVRTELSSSASPATAGIPPSETFTGKSQKVPEGEIALYVDGRLVLSSKKTAPRSPEPLKIPIPGPSMPGTKPYLLPPREDPMSRGVSILDALALAYKAIKDLTAKKPPKPSPPSYTKATSMVFPFFSWESDGELRDGRAEVSLVHAPAVLHE
jgi:hypothetical protein